MVEQSAESHVSGIKRENLMKARIVGATEKLLESTTIDKLSVKAICKEAGISRQTFYRHFESKHAIAEWRWSLIAEKHIREIGRTLTFYEASLKMMEESSRYLRLFYNESISSEYEEILPWATRLNINILRETITEHLHVEMTEELEFQLAFFIEEAGGIIYRSGHKHGHKDYEKLARLLASCVPPDLARVWDLGLKKADRPE